MRSGLVGSGRAVASHLRLGSASALDRTAPAARKRLVGVLDAPFKVGLDVGGSLAFTNDRRVRSPEFVIGPESPDITSGCHERRVRTLPRLWQQPIHCYRAVLRIIHALSVASIVATHEATGGLHDGNYPGH
jgi:hypothetical protein